MLLFLKKIISESNIIIFSLLICFTSTAKETIVNNNVTQNIFDQKLMSKECNYFFIKNKKITSKNIALKNKNNKKLTFECSSAFLSSVYNSLELEKSQSLKRKNKNINTVNTTLPHLKQHKIIEEYNNKEQILAIIARHIGKIIGNKNIIDTSINYVNNIGKNLISQQLNNLLNQYGTAHVSISGDRIFNITGDFLLPIIDNINNLFFIQFGLRTNKYRNILNFGLGYRQCWTNWIYGINTFYDHDYTGGNIRFSLGGEAWTDYLKLVFNSYLGITNWHQSKIFIMDDYDERPATSFDIRAEAYLPTSSKVSGSIRYEKYFGTGVQQDNDIHPNKLEDNPYAFILGINYKPVPLLTFKGEYSLGNRNRNTTMVGMDIVYKFGVPLSHQLDPDAVGITHSLASSKYALVDRNYDIIMQYRKRELINISLPAQINGQAKDKLILSATINKTKYGLKKIKWMVPDNFIANGGNYKIISPTQLEISLPAYIYNISDSEQKYQISAIGIDNNDNKSNIATTIIHVIPSQNIIKELNISPNSSLIADGKQKFNITALVVNQNEQPLPKQIITFNVNGLKKPNGKSGAILYNGTKSESNGQKITAVTDNEGKVSISITSTVTGTAHINVTMENGNYKNSALTFIADQSTAKIAEFNIIKDIALSNGVDENQLKLVVTDAYGNFIPNAIVTFNTDNESVSKLTSIATNVNGEINFSLTNKKAIKSVVTASINNSTKQHKFYFVESHSTPIIIDSNLIVTMNNAIANCIENNKITATVIDMKGNPIPDVDVTFKSSNELIINPRKIKSNGEGKVFANITSKKSGVYTVIATVNGRDTTTQITFKPDSNTARIIDKNFIINSNNAVANGKPHNIVTVIVTDANNNLVPNIDVKFKISDGAVISPLESKTDSKGKVFANITSKKSGVYTVIATVNGRDTTTQITLKPDSNTARIIDKNFFINPNNAVANGKSHNTVTAIVTDANNNLVPNIDVKFKISDGAVISPLEIKTDSKGKAITKVTSVKVGNYTVTAQVNNKSLNKAVHFIADINTAKLAEVRLNDNIINKPANGKDSFNFIAVVKDAHGNFVPNVDVIWQEDKNSNRTSLQNPINVKTNTQGESKINLTSIIAIDNVQVIAQLNNSNQQHKADKKVNFVSDINTAMIQIKSLNNYNIIPADNKSEHQFKINIADINGNVLKDHFVDIFIPDLYFNQKFMTNKNGIIFFSVKSSQAGKFYGTATLSTNKIIYNTFEVKYTIMQLSSTN